jgi:hypothetical protein
MKIDGKCHCGFIEYEVEVDPEGVYVCHCTDCQSISGSPFRWAVSVPAENFKLLVGGPKTYVKISASGATSHQIFCPECASPLYSTAVGVEPKSYNLRLGTARQRAALPPKLEVWCGSAQEWTAIDGSTEKLNKQ